MILFASATPDRFIRGFLTVISALFLCLPIYAQQVWDVYGEPEKGITVTGIVKGETGSGGGASVKIYRDGKFYQEVFAGSTGKYEADLPFDSDYELEFALSGCVTKRIKVETNLPAEAHDQVIEPLAFNMSLPKATNGPLDEAYAVPVSRLFFDKTVDDFNRDMVAEEAFRNTLRAKQAEQKRWLEEQKTKEEEEKQRLKDEELAKEKAEAAERAAAEAAEAKLKAEEAARLKAQADAQKAAEAAEAKRQADEAARLQAEAAAQKAAEAKRQADEAARLKAETEARKAAELAAAKKAQEEATIKAQEEAILRKQQEEEARKQQELKDKLAADNLYKEQERIRLEKEAAAAEAERKKQEAADQALWEKMNDQKAALEKKRQKEIQDSLFRENDKVRMEKEAADKAEAERKKKEADELDHKERMQKQALAEEAERRRQEVSDSLYRDNERLRQEAEAAVAREQEERDRQAAADAASQQTQEPESVPTTGGAGKSIYYQMGDPPPKVRDNSAPDRAANLERKKQERRDAYQSRMERRKEEGVNMRTYESKKQREFLEKQRLIQERRRMVAERNRVREEEAERLRKARLEESLNKKIVVLVAYSTGSTHNPNVKFYGYVNFGDGKGPLELTESEYKALAARYNGIYNKP